MRIKNPIARTMGSVVSRHASDEIPELIVRRPMQSLGVRSYSKSFSITLRPNLISKATSNNSTTTNSAVRFFLSAPSDTIFDPLRDTLPPNVSLVVRRVTAGVCSNPLPVPITVSFAGLDGACDNSLLPPRITLPAVCNCDMRCVLYATPLSDDRLRTYAGVTVESLNAERMRAKVDPFSIPSPVPSNDDDDDDRGNEDTSWDYLNRDGLLYRFIAANRTILNVPSNDVMVKGVSRALLCVVPPAGNVRAKNAISAGSLVDKPNRSDDDDKDESTASVDSTESTDCASQKFTQYDVSDVELKKIAAVRRRVCDKAIDLLNENVLQHMRYTDPSAVRTAVTFDTEFESVLVGALKSCNHDCCFVTVTLRVEYVATCRVRVEDDGVNYYV